MQKSRDWLFWSVERRKWEVPPIGEYIAILDGDKVALAQRGKVTHVRRTIEINRNSCSQQTTL